MYFVTSHLRVSVLLTLCYLMVSQEAVSTSSVCFSSVTQCEEGGFLRINFIYNVTFVHSVNVIHLLRETRLTELYYVL